MTYCGFTLHRSCVVMLWFHISIAGRQWVCLLRRTEKEDFFGLIFFPCSWPQSRSSYCRTWIRRHRWDCNRRYSNRLDHDRFILLLLQLLRDHLLLSPGHMRRRRWSEGRKGRLWVWLLDCLIFLSSPQHRLEMKARYGMTGLLINTMMQLFRRERD